VLLCVLLLLLCNAVLKPGFYAVAISVPGRAITAAAVCPQGFVCPGDTLPVAAFDVNNPTALSATEPSIQACPDALWTKEPGATSPNQCCKWICSCEEVCGFCKLSGLDCVQWGLNKGPQGGIICLPEA